MPQATQITLALESPLEVALSLGSFSRAKQHFTELFSSSSTSQAKIPCLNEIPFTDIHLFNGKLVSFQGMVQDNSFSSELYPLVWKPSGSASNDDLKHSFLTDLNSTPQCNDHQIVQFGDRFVHYLVSIPGSTVPSHLAFPSTHVCISKFPNPSCPHQAMFVKHYDALDYKLGDIVEVFGIFEFYLNEDDVTTTKESLASSSFSSTSMHAYPSIPWAIHVIWSSIKSSFRPLPSFVVSKSAIATARQQCINVIQPYFCDDSLAAEYFLLQLMMLNPQSKPRSHSTASSSSSPSFEFSTFLFPTSSDSASYLSSTSLSSFATFLGQIYPTAYLPLSLDTLNMGSFAPYMDAENEAIGLIAGRLQIAPFTLLLIDETVLNEGALNEQGVKNLQTLMRLLNAQQLDCHLPYSNISYPLPCIPAICCQGKSILPLNESHFEIKVQSDSLSSSTSLKSPETDLQWLSQYLHWAQNQQCHLDSDLAKAIEDTFVQDRKQNKDISQMDLQLELALATRLGKSLGETNLSKETWERARVMEKERKLR